MNTKLIAAHLEAEGQRINTKTRRFKVIYWSGQTRFIESASYAQAIIGAGGKLADIEEVTPSGRPPMAAGTRTNQTGKPQ